MLFPTYLVNAVQISSDLAHQLLSTHDCLNVNRFHSKVTCQPPNVQNIPGQCNPLTSGGWLDDYQTMASY